MTDDLVTVATFEFLAEAELARLRLEGNGLTVFLADAETVNMYWLLGNAIGYTKLLVPRSQAEAATALLEDMRGEAVRHDQRSEELDPDVCLSCGAAMPADNSRCPACGWSYTATYDNG